MTLDFRDVDRPTVHGIAALFESLVNEGLRGVLLAPERGVAHQVLGEGDVLVKALRDGVENARGQRRIERRSRFAHGARVSAWVEQDTLPPQKPT